MLLFLKVQFINSGVMSTPLAKGNAVVNRMAVLAFPILLLNVTVSNLRKKKNAWSSNTVMSWTRTWRKLHGRKNWVPRAIFAWVPSHKLKRPKGGRSYFLQISVSYSSTHKYVFSAKKVPVSVNQIPKSPVHKYAISSSPFTPSEFIDQWRITREKG